MVRAPVKLVSVFVLLVALAVAATTALPERNGEPTPMVREGVQGWDPGPGAAELAPARRMLAEGDAEAAAASARQFVGDASPELDAAARLVLARSLLAIGEAGEALEVLTALRDGDRSPAIAAAADLLRGRAHAALGQTAEALAAYGRAAERDPSVEVYAALRSVEVLRDSGQLEAAQDAAEAAAELPAIRRTHVAVLEALREIQSELDDGNGYLATTHRLLDVATLPHYRAQLAFQAGQFELQIGQREAAIRDLQAAVSAAPDSAHAVAALDALIAQDAADAVEPYQRGLVLYHAGRDQDAIVAFTAALENDPTNHEARYYRGLSRARAGNVPGGVEDLREVARTASDRELAGRALEQAARWLESAGDTAGARAVYQEVLARYGNTGAAASARFRLGFMSYLERDFGAALTIWADGGDARVHFWLGKAREIAGDDAGARAAWEEAARLEPDGYYGLRAADLLGGEPVPSTGQALVGAVIGDAVWRELASWFPERGVDPNAAREALEAEPGLRRAMILLDAGMMQEAGWEIDALAEEHAGDVERLVTLGGVLAERGETTAAAEAVAPLVNVEEGQERSLPPILERLSYPIPYLDLLSEAAERHGADPLLLAALVRQESGFNPQARSSAGALGLAQIMPETGREIARRLGWQDFDPRDLLRPEVSLEFGARYLAERMERYNGYLFAALAAYNAGDSPVDEWLAAPGAEDPDVFAESIPYPETYEYVRRVYVNYQHFLRVYAQPDAGER